MPWKKSPRIKYGAGLDSRPHIGVRGKLHGNDGEDSLFQEVHRSYAKVSNPDVYLLQETEDGQLAFERLWK